MPGDAPCVACSCGSAGALPKSIRRDWLEELTSTTKLSPSEVKALYARFRKLDPNGFLLPDQFRQTMGVLGLSDDTFLTDRMFAVFNVSGSGKLSFHEFATALAVMIRGTEDQKLQLSFEIAAGQRDACELHLEDFQRLIHACNHMMSSLVAPTASLTSDEEVDIIFHNITQPRDTDSNGKEVITLDSYKAAAHNSEEFLHALGLSVKGYHRESARNRGRLARSPAHHRQPSPDGEDAVTVSAKDLEEMQQRLARVEELLKKKMQLRSRVSAMDAPDTQLLETENFPVRPADESQQLDLNWPAMESAWQELGGFLGSSRADGLGQALGAGHISSGSGSGVNGLKSLSPLASDALAPTHRAQEFFSRPASQQWSRASSVGTLPGPEAEKAYSLRSKETMQASHRGVRRRRQHRLLGPAKGLGVHFGHESWNMVLCMMIGIRMSVSRCLHEMQRNLQPVDFIMKEKFTINSRLAMVPYSDEKKTITRFVDFAPLVFQKIRSSFGINEDDYLHSSGPEQLLGNMVLGNLSSFSELSSEGKSGAFFYYTADGKYMMKTVTRKEFTLLHGMLKQYYDHITQNPETMVVRFLGLHCLRVQSKRTGMSRLLPEEKKELYFVVMANMFNTSCEIHRRYDLKGSWVGRVTPADKREPSVALKDVDFQQANERIHVGEERRKVLLEQIKRDSDFLSSNNIIDYSLLLGIHDKEKSAAHSVEPTSPQSVACVANRDSSTGMLSADHQLVYFMGIIDILTPYDSMKVAEHNVKAIRYDRHGVSCCPPPQYAERFYKFMQNAFV